MALLLIGTAAAPPAPSGTWVTAAAERVGRTGVTYGTHLHFEIRVGGAAVDPAPYLGVGPCEKEAVLF